MSDNENASDSSFDGYGFEMVGMEDIEKSDNEREDNEREDNDREDNARENNEGEDNGRENNERESSSDGYNTDDDIEYDKETGTMLIFKHYDSEAEYGDNESDIETDKCSYKYSTPSSRHSSDDEDDEDDNGGLLMPLPDTVYIEDRKIFLMRMYHTLGEQWPIESDAHKFSQVQKEMMPFQTSSTTIRNGAISDIRYAGDERKAICTELGRGIVSVTWLERMKKLVALGKHEQIEFVPTPLAKLNKMQEELDYISSADTGLSYAYATDDDDRSSSDESSRGAGKPSTKWAELQEDRQPPKSPEKSKDDRFVLPPCKDLLCKSAFNEVPHSFEDCDTAKECRGTCCPDCLARVALMLKRTADPEDSGPTDEPRSDRPFAFNAADDAQPNDPAADAPFVFDAQRDETSAADADKQRSQPPRRAYVGASKYALPGKQSAKSGAGQEAVAGSSGDAANGDSAKAAAAGTESAAGRSGDRAKSKDKSRSSIKPKLTARDWTERYLRIAEKSKFFDEPIGDLYEFNIDI